MPQTKLGENQLTYTMNDMPYHIISIQHINISLIFTEPHYTCKNRNQLEKINPNFRPVETFTDAFHKS